MKTLLVVSFLQPFVPASCYHGDGERQALHQAGDAGAKIAVREDLPPDVRQAGGDVRDNVKVVQNSVGVPAAAQPYSPKVSADARDQAAREQSDLPPLLRTVVDLAKPWAPWLPGVAGLVWGFLQKRGRSAAQEQLDGAKNRLVAVYQGVEKLKEDVGGGRYATAITDTLRGVAGVYNVYEDVKTELQALKSAGKVSPARPAPAPLPASRPRSRK